MHLEDGIELLQRQLTSGLRHRAEAVDVLDPDSRTGYGKGIHRPFDDNHSAHPIV
jgi:hypothetical protein